MIKSVISSAAQLSLAPARLAGRVVGSLVSGLRGNGASPARTRRPPSARAKSASGGRARTQPKRAASGTRAKAQRTHTSARSGAKMQAKRTTARTRANAQPKRPAPRTQAKAQPKGTPRRTPPDDATIARKVEAIIFRGVEVDKSAVDVNVAAGVLWLRGEVPTPDLINELEVRANKITEVRRVENLLHLPATPAPSRPEPPAEPPQTSHPAGDREDHATSRVETSEETPAPAPTAPTTTPAAAGHGRAGAPLGDGGGAQTADRSPEDEVPTRTTGETPRGEHLA